jgi:CheY-like chemotaxis protein
MTYHYIQQAADTKLILLVEDDEVHASMLYQLLTQETPYKVYCATDAIAAWKFLQYFKPHLLILDHLLPRMNGLELAEKIQGSPQFHTLPILMVSAALPLHEVKQRGIAYVSKPFDIDDFLQKVEQLISASNG